jgi:hypothetical protein
MKKISLIAILGGVVLAGCGSSDETSSETNTPAPSTATTSTPPPAANPGAMVPGATGAPVDSNSDVGKGGVDIVQPGQASL